MSGEGNTFVFRYADLVRPGSSRGSRSASARTRILLGTEGAGNSQGTPVAAFAIPPTYHRRVGAIPAREVPIASPTPSQPLHQAEGDAWPFQPRLPDPLPSRWEVPAGSVVGNAGAREGERVAQVGHLQIGPGLRIKYVGPGALDSDAAHILVGALDT